MRYEEIIRRSKEDIRKKRALDGDEHSHGPMSYRDKSKLLKEAQSREALAKIQLIDRKKNYSKNVREMYMPRAVSGNRLAA